MPRLRTDRRQAHRVIASLVLLGCAAALSVAWGAERVLGLNPCAFCLLERRPYYLGLYLAALAMLLPARPGRATLWLLTAVLLAGAVLSFTHVGVEQHWWPDPLPECSAPDFSGMTMAQRLAAMPARPAKPCEDPDYLIPGVPISMTQMGFAYALALCTGLAILLTRERGRPIRSDKGFYNLKQTFSFLNRIIVISKSILFLYCYQLGFATLSWRRAANGFRFPTHHSLEQQ